MSLNYPFWVNDFDRVKDHKLKFPLASKIFQYPVSFWYGERNGKEMEKIDYSIQRLLRRTHPQLPILVVYNMPNRDIGQYSKGGAKTRESYLNFLKGFADGIGDNKPILIYEPDSLVHTTEMSKEESSARLSLMQEGLTVLTDNCNALILMQLI